MFPHHSHDSRSAPITAHPSSTRQPTSLSIILSKSDPQKFQLSPLLAITKWSAAPPSPPPPPPLSSLHQHAFLSPPPYIELITMFLVHSCHHHYHYDHNHHHYCYYSVLWSNVTKIQTHTKKIYNTQLKHQQYCNMCGFHCNTYTSSITSTSLRSTSSPFTITTFTTIITTIQQFIHTPSTGSSQGHPSHLVTWQWLGEEVIREGVARVGKEGESKAVNLPSWLWCLSRVPCGRERVREGDGREEEQGVGGEEMLRDMKKRLEDKQKEKNQVKCI